jgi:hypothetical protein
MSTIKYWNFRILDTKRGPVIIEAYYDKNNGLVAWNPASATYVKTDRKMIRKALKLPILSRSDFPTGA